LLSEITTSAKVGKLFGIVSGSLGHGGLLAESLLAFGVYLLLETLEGCLVLRYLRSRGIELLLQFSLPSGCLLSSLFEFALCCCRSTSRCLELGLQSLLIGCQREHLLLESRSLLFGLSE